MSEKNDGLTVVELRSGRRMVTLYKHGSACMGYPLPEGVTTDDVVKSWLWNVDENPDMCCHLCLAIIRAEDRYCPECGLDKFWKRPGFKVDGGAGHVRPGTGADSTSDPD